MKILYCIDHLRPDGTQRFLLHLIDGLAKRGHHQSVLCLNYGWDEELVKDLKAAGAEIRLLNALSVLSGYGFLSAFFWMRHRQFDVAVPMLFVSDIVGRALARAAGIPRVVASIRARNINYTKWKYWLARFTMRWVDIVVLNSSSVRDFAVKEEGAPENRIFVIPNGVELSDYSELEDRDEVLAELSLPSEAITIGSVGRLDVQKGFDILLQACAQLLRTDIHILIIGEGRERNKLVQQSEELGLEHNVHFLGYRRDVPRLLAALDLYVQPSRFEGMPNALLEAMAVGCPIVASAVDGICELIEEGKHGWLVAPENPGALATTIGIALDDIQGSTCFGAAARERATTVFNVGNMIDSWEKVLAERILQ
jgi:glycosyltransferase involved in cell wall biosynthesis